MIFWAPKSLTMTLLCYSVILVCFKKNYEAYFIPLGKKYRLPAGGSLGWIINPITFKKLQSNVHGGGEDSPTQVLDYDIIRDIGYSFKQLYTSILDAWCFLGPFGTYAILLGLRCTQYIILPRWNFYPSWKLCIQWFRTKEFSVKLKKSLQKGQINIFLLLIEYQ